MSELDIFKIERMIYVVRNQKVMLDADLAKLYGVETKRLNEQVKRNLDRFPEDFMFEPTFSELATLRSQFATSGDSSTENYYLRHSPLLFTELGVAMLSSVLNGQKSISVNISIMRTFVKLRSFLLMEENLSDRVKTLEKGTNKLFKVVFERMDHLEEIVIRNWEKIKEVALNPEKIVKSYVEVA